MSLFYRRRMLLQKKRSGPVGTMKTTLFNDGTFIINELPEDREANIALHGAVTNEYEPLDDANSYVFGTLQDRPWNSSINFINKVEFGSPVQPTSMYLWFSGARYLTLFDSTNLDTSKTTNISFVLNGCSSSLTVDVSTWDVSSVTTAASVFSGTPTGFESWDVSSITNMSSMFATCQLTSLDLSSWNISNVTTLSIFVSSCTNLRTMNLFSPDSTTYYIDTGTIFGYCTQLRSVTINLPSLLRMTNSNCFTMVPSNCEFYVPSNLVSSYKSATNWSSRKNYIFAKP